MKAEQLANILKAFKGFEVILSTDEEGNGFGTIERVQSCFGVQKVRKNGKAINVLVLYPYRDIDADNFNSSFIEATKEVK